MYILEINEIFFWHEMIDMVKLADLEIRKESHAVVMVYHFSTLGGASIPNGNIFSLFKEMSEIVTPNVSRIFFVCKFQTLLTFLQRLLVMVNHRFPTTQENYHKFNYKNELSEVVALLDSDA